MAYQSLFLNACELVGVDYICSYRTTLFTCFCSRYTIYLEPDNTIHGPITHEPQFDAGGMLDANPRFGIGIVQHVAAQARKLPGKSHFTWSGYVVFVLHTFLLKLMSFALGGAVGGDGVGVVMVVVVSVVLIIVIAMERWWQ